MRGCGREKAWAEKEAAAGGEEEVAVFLSLLLSLGRERKRKREREKEVLRSKKNGRAVDCRAGFRKKKKKTRSKASTQTPLSNARLDARIGPDSPFDGFSRTWRDHDAHVGSLGGVAWRHREGAKERVFDDSIERREQEGV